VSVPVTLSDLERRDARNQNFLAHFHNNYVQTVWPRATKFGVVIHVVIHVGQKRVSRVSATLSSQGVWSQRPPIFWDPAYVQTVWPRATNFGVINMWESSVFLGGRHAPVLRGGAPSSPKVFGTSNMRTYTLCPGQTDPLRQRAIEMPILDVSW